jgi:hypothetical protein
MESKIGTLGPYHLGTEMRETYFSHVIGLQLTILPKSRGSSLLDDKYIVVRVYTVHTTTVRIEVMMW